MTVDIPSNELAKCFEYLDELRESGRTNMYGARPYLVREMGLDRDLAGEVLSAWMKSFDPALPAYDRALKVQDLSP